MIDYRFLLFLVVLFAFSLALILLANWVIRTYELPKRWRRRDER